MGGIFISYRGDDSGTAAALIDRELTASFGSELVFLDSRSIPVGADFIDELLGRLRSCTVCLVVIGPRWLTPINEAGQRRIDNPADWVRREIAEALTHHLRVVPVLLDGTRLPSAAELPPDLAGLCRRQYTVLRCRHIEADLAELVERIIEAEPALAAAANFVHESQIHNPRNIAPRAYSAQVGTLNRSHLTPWIIPTAPSRAPRDGRIR